MDLGLPHLVPSYARNRPRNRLRRFGPRLTPGPPTDTPHDGNLKRLAPMPMIFERWRRGLLEEQMNAFVGQLMVTGAWLG